MTCYGTVRTRLSQQEWYETSTGDAARRARQLRKAGYRASVQSMGRQVTSAGLVRMSLLTILNPDDNVPEPEAAVAI